MGPGKFITFEGIEGSGKSTQIDMLHKHLEACGHEVHRLREPGGTAVGDRIRAILLDPDLSEMTDITEMLLFAASRAQLIRQEVRPALAAGKTVLCDRFVYSSLAYQAYARGLPVETVRAANAPAIEGLLPDKVVLLDLSPEVALQRAKARAALDRIEAEALSFHQAVRRGFLEEAGADSERFCVITAEGSPQDIHGRILDALKALL
jgi:dTMP kinase